jgi:hypothetical protein
MDPAYQRLEQLVSPEEAKRRYPQLNTVGSMFSQRSDVLTDINRGTRRRRAGTGAAKPGTQ